MARERKQIEEKLGPASKFTERQAGLIRAERQAGKAQTNSEKRQKEKEARLKGHGPLTFARLWELYPEANKDKPAIKGDTFRFNNHIAPYLAGKEAEKISTGDIYSIRRKVEAKGLAPQTIKHVLGQIRRLMRYGQSLVLLVMTTALVFHMPKVDNQKTEHMTDTQLAAYLKALEEEEDQDAAAFLRLELYTGIRRGTCMNLMWQDSV